MASRSSVLRDLRAGGLVSLLALPLCLGIAAASGFPPVAGLLTAIVGGLLTPLLGGAPRTIKGPAAGLIVVVLASVHELGGGDAWAGYRATLAVVVASGVAQALLAQLGAARLVEMVPPAVLHGVLVAIGLVILVKQLPVLLGLELADVSVMGMLPAIAGALDKVRPTAALSGAAALAVVLAMPALARRGVRVGPLPAPLLAVGVGAGVALALGGGAATPQLPHELGGVLVLPDFGALARPAAWTHVLLLTLVGSLESLVSLRAVDQLAGTRSDPARDLGAIGLGNALAGAIGGLPMITEIVRSTANVHHGAESGRANAAHGAALLLALVLLPGALEQVPLAVLAALLLAVAGRLADPGSFRREMNVGVDQMLIFSATVVASLFVDLLAGIGAGVATKLALHVANGAPLRALVGPDLEVEGSTLRVRGAAVFSGWPRFRDAIDAARQTQGAIIVDLSEARLVDHTVLQRLETRRERGDLEWVGLDGHRTLGAHPLATRVRRPADESVPASEASDPRR
ncbi:MAG TPA: SulP family inorganic anion transporter [Polyangiaceae bacterium LLY-WYZ-15_(1-7)]|nr:SulP family inorganic anion transporter [Polyangiaceae bacterium LLY-WYZ-15_(1-7)]HJL13830.1 SulP family inorganic anion transporter [Polyangiaceae bacterium LLY-WYZ-15_(1-7)]HJL38536.1 SulP family inorganic anion transporter [Polyangiaceae bacterium LLY-WYZ-15_(1-7)]HJL50445.1 SulP family inorganic anion transporter [Polyangiaceae bacterium LLY-WYZ-15_(1-7)]